MEGTRYSSPWIPCLLALTIIHLFLFVGLTYLQLSDIDDINELDVSLEQRIQLLQANIKEVNEKRQKRSTSLISELLVQQEQVIAQHCINRNKTCLKGATGEPGVKGDIGMKGIKGDPGSQGQPGIIGLPGSNGVQGERGITGTKGNEGDDGIRGIGGDKGQKGNSSPPGQKGEMGDAGARGVYGLPGPQGIKGDQGVTGSNGTTGVVGEPGPHGINGSKGDTGDLGINGGDRVVKPADGCLCIKPPSARSNIYTADEYISYIQKRSASSPGDENQRKTKVNKSAVNSKLQHQDDLKEQFTIHQPGTHYIRDEATIHLNCKPTDASNQPITWYKDGVQIKTLQKERLSIIQFCNEMEGNYECREQTSDGTWNITRFSLYLEK